ncbi:nicotinate-nucleotide adenylyltransferase [Paenibacillus nanensis]|uniref:Probable nicotinate-nucleotide adenylyltransferase n=1 Tax=Paenibacillus nanensis TaxID=393251 RepID=A0A3A1VLM5_9BACL|nr:nicotinate-nucleotide adenylyltransferase [Paenibacillus nanensis]RIX59423.1 nicotinate-nucleotide adenylyltransferase [Paenibacillus nanensis]
MKIGIMGGTFDPIHIGHLIAAESAREQAGLDEVWFIPTADPPLKDRAPRAAAEQRYEMVRLAVESNSRFRVLDIEKKRGGVSYSIDTVTELRKQYPGHTFSYIIGSDRMNDLPRWHRIGELSKLAGFIGLERPENTLQLDGLPSYLRETLQLVRMPQIGISSTELRERLAGGLSVRYLVTEPVFDYIRRHRLYGPRNDD